MILAYDVMQSVRCSDACPGHLNEMRTPRTSKGNEDIQETHKALTELVI